MDKGFFVYLQQLELMGFFSGYAIIYSVVLFLADTPPLKGKFTKRLVALLPFSYALVGTLFLGFLLKKIYPDYSIEHIKQVIQQPWLILLALFSMLFWIPALSKKKVLTLIHSLVFFFFLASDLFVQLFSSSTESDVIKNDMKVYVASIILNLATLAFLVLLSLLFSYYKKRPQA